MNPIPIQYNPYPATMPNPYYQSYPIIAQNTYTSYDQTYPNAIMNPYMYYEPVPSITTYPPVTPVQTNQSSDTTLSTDDNIKNQVVPTRKSSKAKASSAMKKQNISLTVQEKQELKQRARSANMSISDYIRKRCIYDSDKAEIDHAADILQHVAKVSDYVDLIEDQELKKALTKEVMAIWRFLNQQT